MTVFIYCETLHYDKLNIVVQVPNLSSKESMHTYIHTHTHQHTPTPITEIQRFSYLYHNPLSWWQDSVDMDWL